MIKLGGIKRYNSVKYLVVDEVDACLLDNHGKVASTALASSGTPLHELLSTYLSPTYVDGKDAAALDAAMTSTFGNGKDAKRPVLQSRTTIFCSATIPQRNHFAKQCLQNQWMLQEPRNICLRNGEQLLPTQLSHAFMVCASTEKKLPALRRVLKKIRAAMMKNAAGTNEAYEKKKVLVFAENHRPLEEMAKVIANDADGVYWNEPVAASGTIVPKNALISVLRYEDSLSQRAAAMDAFRGEDSRTNPRNKHQRYDASVAAAADNIPFRVMFSSDLAARGIDISDITHVIHLDLPASADTYVHRSGRTGRLGRAGQVLSIVTSKQEFVLQRLANKLAVNMSCIGRQTK